MMDAHTKSIFMRHPLAAYFILAFAITWLILSPGVASTLGLLAMEFDGSLLFTFSALGPMTAAFIVTAATEGHSGVRKLVRNMFNWRVEARWWMAATLPFAALFAVASLISLFTGGAAPDLGPATTLIATLFFLLIAEFGEETGWRGFALPRLQQTRSPMQATLLLSFFWWFWHLPVYWVLPFAVEAVQQSGFWAIFGGQFVICLALGILCAWVYNGSHGSILMAVLLHANWNFWLIHFANQGVSTFVLPLFVTAAIVVGFATKGKLGVR